jgi:A/G-specific adenine glycosylase
LPSRKRQNTLSTDLTPPFKSWLRRRLLAWFDRHRRDLPWRRSRDAYAIWVSEVMLQQTQVATVIPYYQRFLARFPCVADLAAADEQEVLRHWEGLGYYRRARSLHRAARVLVTEYRGELPDDPEVWRQLPGIGRYTLGAILSQAFDRRLPIVEANSQRLLCRLFTLREPPPATAAQKRLWQLAEAILPARRAGDFNQALMELGALVCTPAAPACERCPLARHCRARQLGIQDQLPMRAPAPLAEHLDEVAVVVRRGDKVLVVQRPADARRWANLWEFPHDVLQAGETHETAAARILAEATAVKADVGTELATVRHGVTRFKITLVCLAAAFRGGRFRCGQYQQGRWVAPPRLAELPFSTPQRRLARLLNQTTQPRLF